MQLILRESLVAAGGERVEITVTLPPGDRDAETAWRHALAALDGLAGDHLAINGQRAPAAGADLKPDTLGNGHRTSSSHRPAELTERSSNIVWTKPDLHGKTLKTAHRVALAIHELTEARRTPNVDNITAKARTSRPPIYNIADPKTAAGQYMAPYVISQKIGREIVLDLTPKGRQLVSLIRAGKVPA